MTPRQVTVSAERLAGWLAGFATRHGTTDSQADAIELRLVGTDGARAWLTVPFPPLPPVDPGVDACAALVAHATRARTVGVVLVRRGGYAVGVFEGAQLVTSKVGSSYVQGTTKAGGWSQQRFARRRANQAHAAFAEAADVTERLLLPHAATLDAVICGGDRTAVGEVLSDPRLGPLAELRADPFLPVGDPRLRVLQATPAQFRAVRVALDP